MSEGGALVEARRLSKRFGHVVAVAEVSFAMGRGEVLGFLGPNGAGKSTTMKMLTGFLAPSGGNALVAGIDVARDPLAARRRIGYLPEGAPAYPDMTPSGFLAFCARSRGYAGAEAAGRVAKAADLVSLGPVMHQPIETLSKGFKRRVGLAQALLHDPDILILDEPTDGLDPNQKYEVRRLIAEIAPQKAIIISTHILEEVDAVCTRAVVIARGRILADDAPGALARRSRHHNAVRIEVAPAEREAARAAVEALPTVASVAFERDADGEALFAFARDGAPIVGNIAGALGAHGVQPLGLRVERGRLDDVFRTITTAAA